jgi:predicted permease
MTTALYILLFCIISFVWFVCGMIYLIPNSKHYNKLTKNILWHKFKECLILGPLSIIIILIPEKKQNKIERS